MLSLIEFMSVLRAKITSLAVAALWSCAIATKLVASKPTASPAHAIATAAKSEPGVVDVDTSLNVGKPELSVNLDRLKAADLGVQISDAAALASIVDDVLAANPAAVADHRAGKPSLKFLVGQVMKTSRGQANAALVEVALHERLGDAGAGETDGTSSQKRRPHGARES